MLSNIFFYHPISRWPHHHGRSMVWKYLAILLCASYCIQQAQAQPNINRIEYYIDTDPGYGAATTVAYTGANNISTSFNINLEPLGEGVHVVGVRSRDVNGAWSIDNKWIFLKPYSINGNTTVPNINRVEYYVDNDPGYGSATPISITPGQNLQALVINLNLVPLTEGVHIIGIRSQDANGSWSIDNKWIFLKPYTTAGNGPAPIINRVEYYVDKDPGYGNGTALPITPGANIAGLSFDINMTPYTEGVHIVGLRSRDANGAWSIDNRWLFLKRYSLNTGAGNRRISQIEYYFDTDPGYGNGIQVAVLPNADISSKDIFANITGLTAGAHVLGIRSKDSTGVWGMDNKWNINITAPVAAPKLEINSIAKTEACVKDSIIVGYDISGTFNAGNSFKVFLSDNAGSFTNEKEIGTVNSTKDGLIKCYLPAGLPDGNGYKVRIKSSNPVLVSATASYTLSFYDRPFFRNDTTVFLACGSDVFNLNNIYNPGNYTLKWNTTTPEEASMGIYKLMAINQNGCADTVGVTVKLEVTTWTGISSNNWHTPGNWSDGKVPTAITHAIVPANTPNPCVVSTGDAVAASVQIRPGGIMRVIDSRKVNLSANCSPLPTGP